MGAPFWVVVKQMRGREKDGLQLLLAVLLYVDSNLWKNNGWVAHAIQRHEAIDGCSGKSSQRMNLPTRTISYCKVLCIPLL